MQMIDAVFFDYGGVLTSSVKHSIASWLAADAIESKSFSRTLLRPGFVNSGQPYAPQMALQNAQWE